jgi:hypothetical protein
VSNLPCPGRPKVRIGDAFGQLLVIEEAEPAIRPDTGAKVRRVLCLCSCGKTTIVATQRLTQGVTRSCGHIKRELRPVKATPEAVASWRFAYAAGLTRYQIASTFGVSYNTICRALSRGKSRRRRVTP